jgi:uncharacterized protein YxeA
MKKIILILTIITLMIISFMAGILYFPYQNKKFDESSIGTKLNENRKKWGKPDKVDVNQYEIIDTYYPIVPLNEYKFFFNKNDSLMNRRWKEY